VDVNQASRHKHNDRERASYKDLQLFLHQIPPSSSGSAGLWFYFRPEIFRP
jgi:hypothetical protein